MWCCWVRPPPSHLFMDAGVSGWMQVWVDGHVYACVCVCVCVYTPVLRVKTRSFHLHPFISIFSKIYSTSLKSECFFPSILLSNALLSSSASFPASAKVMSMWLLLLFNSSFQTVWPLSGASLSGGCRAFSFSPEKIQLTFGSHQHAVQLTLANKKMTLCSPTDWRGLGMRLSQ